MTHDLSQTPRALAIRVAELEQQLNAAKAEIQTRETAYHAVVGENRLLKQELDHAHGEVAEIQHLYKGEHAYYMSIKQDAYRFYHWFFNGDNEDEQLLELKRQKAMDPKSVTLDMWRTAIDAAMEKKKHVR